MATAKVSQQNDTKDDADTPYTQPGPNYNICLEVEDKPLYFNRDTLMMASPVFSKMFSSDFKERDQKELELPGKSYQAVRNMLACIDPGTIQPVTDATVDELLPLFDEYQMDVCRARCGEVLKKRITTCTNETTIIAAAVVTERHNLPTVVQAATKVLAVFQTEDLQVALEQADLCAETREAVYRERALQAELDHKKSIQELVKTAKGIGRYNNVRSHVERCYVHKASGEYLYNVRYNETCTKCRDSAKSLIRDCLKL